MVKQHEVAGTTGTPAVRGSTARAAGALSTQVCLLCALMAIVFAALLWSADDARASKIVARDATKVRLEIDNRGRALITYRQGRRTVRVVAWGAIGTQTRMRLDYSPNGWRTFRDRSTRYDGPDLPVLVEAVRAPDGSYWALQAWERGLPNYGAPPRTRNQRALELHLSHWRGDELPTTEAWVDWTQNRRFRQLFGRYTYEGKGIFGESNTPGGNPTDAFGRNVYLDTFDSARGDGWKRENSFLTHKPGGTFCYGFFVHRGHTGDGKRYRITSQGPGVTPVVRWEGDDPGPYDPAIENELLAIQEDVVGGDPRCAGG